MLEDRGLWSDSVRSFMLNIKPATVYVIAMMALGFLEDALDIGSGMVVAQALIAAMLAIPAHLTLLKGVSGMGAMADKGANNNFLSFALRGLGLGALAVLVPLLLLIVLMAAGLNFGAAVSPTGFMFLLSLCFVFARWGTMLPALLAGDDKTMATAVQRATRTGTYAFFHLMVPFGLLTVLTIAPAIIIVMMSDGDGRFLPANGSIDLPLIFATVLSNVVGAFQVVMIAVVLSRAYLRAMQTADFTVPA